MISTNEIVEHSAFQARFFAEAYNGYHGRRQTFFQREEGDVDILFLVVGQATRIDVYKKENVKCYGNSCMQCFLLVRKLYIEQMFVLVSMDILRLS